ncbi:cyclin-dependent kinase 4 inhibitor C [Etheostoma spectabile]|uniref:cyclin-dependent kinase 4 inhibitor C n=1 Tax=Etheostoma spectabile TaxID=54343 RepID=UPI0013AFA6F4|nr:cyclin-dependent kinase 4 inhibitor C [Etheostoma spectabile]XP_032380684.1 cyclin-dependent kinase 4 inhibitor C [Etheostoma spectabile]XP_032380685.1 cyclin-dependent kinase 4 inhibitor C [Etheostoma spectabile]
MADTLCNASAQGNLPKVLLLLQSGADVNGFSSYNMTALQVVKLGNDALVGALLEAGSDPNVREPFCGLTVTHDAAREGFLDSLRVLVNHGADLNLVDKKGNLPLHLAAREGHLKVVQLLIGLTANPQAPNGDGRTAGQLAHLHGKVATAQYIEDYCSAH